MILLLGGTTEGRKAVEVLEEAGNCFYYSTKTGEQELTLHHGIRTDGAMDSEAMTVFCRTHNVGLIVDAAHPFAARLHETVAEVAHSLRLPAIRYERMFPPRDASLTWLDDYTDLPRDIHTLLATTGVQTIARLRPLEAAGTRVYYRILPRESSIRLAHEQGATDDQLCFYDEDQPLPPPPAGMSWKGAAMLLKESGESGGFTAKVAAAKTAGMRIFVLKRPATPALFHCVNGPHGLRRAVEQLLPDFFPLKSGLTTGTCATAAAVAASTRLLHGGTPAEVPVILPDGETISVAVSYGPDYACCYKESGDDPDVTNGLEIRVTAERADHFAIRGGQGVGRFTLPGFDFPPGEAAINRAPREMMRRNISENVVLTVSIPDGEAIARRTFNPRLGIVGGISIIGVSGIVLPFSEQAFTDSIRKCMQVAAASGSQRVVIHSGAKSERHLHDYYPTLPTQAFVEYGNYIGHTIQAAADMGVSRLTLGIMLGKAVKLAQGHLDTHSKRVVMDKEFIREMLREADIDVDLTTMTLARELWTLVPPHQLQAMADVVIAHCYAHCQPLLPKGQLTILLLTDEGTVYASSTMRTDID